MVIFFKKKTLNIVGVSTNINNPTIVENIFQNPSSITTESIRSLRIAIWTENGVTFDDTNHVLFRTIMLGFY